MIVRMFHITYILNSRVCAKATWGTNLFVLEMFLFPILKWKSKSTNKFLPDPGAGFFIKIKLKCIPKECF